MSEDGARTGPDVLDTGVRRRRWSWLLAAILIVASAVWLQGRGPEPGDLPRSAEVALLAGYLPSTIAHSGDGGRSWSVSALSRGTPRPAPAVAPVTGGPVLATVVDGSRLATYYPSSDGRPWSRVVPPAVA